MTFNVYRHNTAPVPLDAAHRIASGLSAGVLNDYDGYYQAYYVVTGAQRRGEQSLEYGRCLRLAAVSSPRLSGLKSGNRPLKRATITVPPKPGARAIGSTQPAAIQTETSAAIQPAAQSAGQEELATTVITYEYDPLYRLTAANYTGAITATYGYAYDAVGNMTAFTKTIGAETEAFERSFDQANQLQNTYSVSGEFFLPVESYDYDANGNLKLVALEASFGGTHYIYNQRNLLVRTFLYTGGPVPGSTFPKADFAYDGTGNRVQQVDYTGGTTTTITYTNDIMGLSQVLVASNGITTTHNLFGLDLLGQQTNGQTTPRTFLADGLGSVRTEMAGGTVETVTTYEPYGNLLAQTGSSGTTYGFTGEQHNAATGLQYLRARYYNPALRVFLSRDPYPGSPGRPSTQHGYSYVSNNPVNYTDPSGNCVFFGIDTLICLGAGIGFISNMGIQTYNNTRAGMSFLEAINHENIDWIPVAASTTAGGLSGAIAPLIPAGTSFGGVLAYGGLDGFLSGILDQGILNMLMPCRDWHEDLLQTGVSSGIAGAFTAGVFDAGGRAVSGIFRSLDGNRFVPGHLGGMSNVTTSKFTPNDLDDLRQFSEQVRQTNNARGYNSFGEIWAQLGEMGSQNLYIAKAGDDVTGAMLLGGNKHYFGDAIALEVKFLEGAGGGSGTALLQSAHQVSKQRGLGGAIILYASDQAVPFYKRFPGYVFDSSSNMFYWSSEAAKVAFGG